MHTTRGVWRRRNCAAAFNWRNTCAQPLNLKANLNERNRNRGELFSKASAARCSALLTSGAPPFCKRCPRGSRSSHFRSWASPFLRQSWQNATSARTLLVYDGEAECRGRLDHARMSSEEAKLEMSLSDSRAEPRRSFKVSARRRYVSRKACPKK